MNKNLAQLLENLSPEEELELETFVGLLIARRGSNGEKSFSILELKGLGKEIWEGIDAQEYVDQERRSWNG